MSGQVATVEKMQAPTQASAQPVTSILDAIQRFVMNPEIDPDRFMKAMDAYRDFEDRQAKLDFANAMAAAQTEMRVVVADKNNTQTRSKYASYAALDSAVRPIYTKHGFSVTFDTEDVDKPDTVRVVAFVSNSGHERRYHLDMPADGKGAKGGDVMTKTHAVMSATSYGKRGLLILIFNIPVADRWDDDGNAASGGGGTSPFLTEAQLKQLRDALSFRDIPDARACKRFKVERLEDIRQCDFEAFMRIAQNAGVRP